MPVVAHSHRSSRVQESLLLVARVRLLPCRSIVVEFAAVPSRFQRELASGRGLGRYMRKNLTRYRMSVELWEFSSEGTAPTMFVGKKPSAFEMVPLGCLVVALCDGKELISLL